VSNDNLLTKRPAEVASAGGAGVGAIVVGILFEVWGIELGPYTTAGVVGLVGIIAPLVTAFVARYRDQK
jgi:hypothetical protein